MLKQSFLGTMNTAKFSTIAVYSPFPFLLDHFLSTISFSHIERHENLISLFMCHVSNTCQCDELRIHRDPMRIDLDLINHKINIWLLSYDKAHPDFVIENSIICSPAKP